MNIALDIVRGIATVNGVAYELTPAVARTPPWLGAPLPGCYTVARNGVAWGTTFTDGGSSTRADPDPVVNRVRATVVAALALAIKARLR